MAIIYSYPSKPIPSLSDQILITDSDSSEPENATRNATLASIKTAIDVVDKITDINGNNGQTGDIKFAGSNTIDIDFNAGTNSITFDTKTVTTGSGTAGTIPKWSDSNTLTDSIIKDQGGEDIIIPRFIKHDGDLTNVFGFSNAREFIVSVGPSTADQFSVAENAIIMKTDSGTKVAAGPTGVTLYSDTSETATTTSVARFATTTTGAIVYGQTIAQGAASERGGIIRYYNNTNNRYVGIAGPITQGTNYQIRLPDTIGTVGQVLAIGSIDGINAIMQWVDNSGGGRTCNLTITSTVTAETFLGAADGTASIAIADGIANYSVTLTHTDSTVKTSTSTTSPIAFTAMKSGTWTISGEDNNPSGDTKCPLSGTLTIAAGSCDLTTTLTDKVDASTPIIQNGSVKVGYSNFISTVNITLTNTDGKWNTQTASGTSVTFTGLGAGEWTAAGVDPANSCSTSETFRIESNLTLRFTQAGSGYNTDDTYSMASTSGSGTGMQITCDSNGANPVITDAGSGYSDGDTVKADQNVTDPGSPPDVAAEYEILIAS